MNALLQFALLVLLAPLLQGILRSARARLQGRPGPSPLQAYRDLRKWWSKEAVLAEGTSTLVTVAPGIVLGAMLTLAALVPPVGSPGGLGANAIAIVLVLALARAVLVLAALDVRSSFSGMAASREMTFAALTEGPLLLALVSTWAAGTGATAGGSAPLAGTLAAGALLLVMLAETARIPVDNQETHYELTMIHEGLILEYAGWQLALVHAAAYLRQAAFYLLAAQLLPGGPAATIGWLVLFIAIVPAVERAYAKMRLFEVPQLFLSATVLALASIGLRMVGLSTW